LRFNKLSSLPYSEGCILVLEAALTLLCRGCGESETTEVAAVEVRPFEGPEAVDDVVPLLLLNPVEGVLTTLLWSWSSVAVLIGRA
jgi:hypothetical protein